jgi:hypothetical protein
MASPENPMSGDRVDVLDRLSVSQHCKQCKYCAVIAKSVSPRIAELIEAADAYATGYMQDEAEEDPRWYVCGAEQRKAAQRVFAAIHACRQGDEK